MIVADSFRNQRVAVFGLARTGLSAAKALLAGGATVVAWDDKAASRDAAAAEGVPLGDLRTADWSGIAALVLAPGVPLTHPVPHDVVKLAQAAGVPVIGDMELFARSSQRVAGTQVVLITGTNGKSTTTALIAHLIRAAGLPVAVGGNLGTAVLDLAPVPAGGVYVFEISSYQIDLIDTLVPDVGVLLNITPDHLDRHGGMAGYVATKARLFRGQGAAQTAVVGIDDEYSAGIAAHLEGLGRAVTPITVGQTLAHGVSVVDGVLLDDGEAVYDLKTLLRLPGAHNWQNAAAAYATLKGLGLARDAALRGLADFPGLAHRMELVATHHGVRYVNDSKATNADAAAKALGAYEHIFWIAGGKPKAGGIEGLDAFWPRIRRAYLIGEAANDFASTLAGHVDAVIVGELAHAVQSAARDAAQVATERPVVLLSPACASFDQFADFEERGDRFRALVQALVEAAA
ncbi:UDP-N-acetylmuramoyl-L-alanine--D-glutamate ligase [Oleomonas cavernae]|uniref:UDP-N-acetylmuramoylalanine--D-glutamate ligase n=1 Tax=Oleomonas cavernae TaxID=2320859 RepID=A0A418W9E3_9PROT|nr:UDP-N-acetylmuramoyl-L-alanine--D-glutamate ligase [Oleomonas cavernae]RJF86554.1 UDP-N-acetylmuramoyl-L-alanine--D-glutamate ligase [Oleomonas cavernae]